MTQPAGVRLPGVMWHVTVTLHGHPLEPGRLAAGLELLAFAHGIDLSARYAPDLVELRYWDEGQDCRVVVGHALHLWDSHRPDADLPAWPVVGVEVLDRPTFRRRWRAGSDEGELFTPGVRPLRPSPDEPYS
jgi:hypothetical protein